MIFSTLPRQILLAERVCLCNLETCLFPLFQRAMPRYLLVLGLPLVAPKPNLLSKHDNILLDDDKNLEEYALLQRNAKRFRNSKRSREELIPNTQNLEDVSPGLNKWLLNTTDAEDLPHWKKQLLQMQAESDLLSNLDRFERGTFSLQMVRE